MKKFLIFSLSLLIYISLQAQAYINKTIVVDGLNRDYIIHLPKNYGMLQSAPVIFALHGSGGEDEGTDKLYMLDGPADKYGFIVVYPNAIYKNWNIPGITAYGKIDSAADDVHFISALMDTVVRFYKGDSTRMFATGLSRGGKFAFYLAWKLNSRIRAIAPVCASIPRNMEDVYHFDRPTPVLLINGTADPLVSYTGGYGKFNVGTHTGAGFDMTPTEELVKKLVGLDSCNSMATVDSIPDIDPNDNCTATKYYYTSDKAPVEFIKITGGGHTWPGSKQYMPKFIIGPVCKDFSAADEIFKFFISVSK